jgi:hypothetical protein
VFSRGEPVRPASLQPGVTFAFDRDVVDHRLLDAFSLAAAARGMQHPICGHSGFWTRREYESAVGALSAPGG